ncbi:GyrI-like domain-containing protein [Enterococcus saccharolyticus]|uniref:GyrI-like domain-containing protein n=1 Tax=Enterococcus saccharolyticus TaxID=41997 RepID=UPI001E63744B|nr:GyrI-like domain-containing protein [Enterococcus saccharolyticus]MCD5002932.1 GyrI-like domain-containing protein [Enterococcus saccharolyticus]
MKKIDFKKEYKQYYLPKNKPEIIKIPSMNFLAIRGAGDPNEPDGMYAQAISKLYAISYTIKMKGKHLEGYYEYVVPPLEGFWWMDGLKGVDYNHKEKFRWISVIRLPDFVSKTDVEWAISLATETKKKDYSAVEFFVYDEGECVQMMHIGSYDDEPQTLAVMNDFLKEQGYEPDFEPRMHHEIYISDPRKTEADKLKTVIRHPVKLTTLK